MKPKKDTIRLQFTVLPGYEEKLKALNTSPFDSLSVFLMKLIDREFALISPKPRSTEVAHTQGIDIYNVDQTPPTPTKAAQANKDLIDQQFGHIMANLEE